MAAGGEDWGAALREGARFGELEEGRAALGAGGAGALGSAGPGGAQALHMAAANGHGEVVAALLAAGADARAPNAEGSTPLHWAALNGHAGVARQLLAAGSSATALNKHDRTPLDEALGGGHEDVRAALAEAVPKADIPEQDKTLDNEGNPLAGVEEGGEGDDSMET